MNFVFESIKELIFYLGACTGGNKGDEMRDERKKEASTHEKVIKNAKIGQKFSNLTPNTNPKMAFLLCRTGSTNFRFSLFKPSPASSFKKHYLNYEFQFDLLQKKTSYSSIYKGRLRSFCE